MSEAEDVARLVQRARSSQPAWAGLGFDGRARVLLRARRWLLDHGDEVVATIVAETGKTYEDALLGEVAYAARACRFWAKQAPRYLATERLGGGRRRHMEVRRDPVGVVGVIGPWNFPLTNTFGDALPALAAGNAVVVKPSPGTPRTSLLMARMLGECGMPDGAFAVAQGGASAGEALIDAADYVAFTGSTATGRRVAERAGRALTPVGLELGGNDPMLVLADADLDRAANLAAYYGTFHAGQACVAIERVYVDETVHDAFVARLTAAVAGLRPAAAGRAPGSGEVGATFSDAQIEHVASHVHDAVARGARVAIGAPPPAPGGARLFPPTVLVDVDHSMAVMREETFGPVVPVMRVTGADQAVELANDSAYGLQASIFSSDVEHASALADRLDCGVVCVNDAVRNYAALELPMGGRKGSGLGARHGAEGIRRFTAGKSVFVTRRAGSREVFM